MTRRRGASVRAPGPAIDLRPCPAVRSAARLRSVVDPKSVALRGIRFRAATFSAARPRAAGTVR